MVHNLDYELAYPIYPVASSLEVCRK